MDRKEARQLVNAHPLTDYVELEKSRSGMYCCPACNSGHGTNQSGALKLYANPYRVCCYSDGCALGGKGQDTLGALRAIWKCSEAEVFERVGVDVDRPRAQRIEEPKPEPEWTSFYAKAHMDLLSSEEALAYLHGRGISDASIERFQLGYCARWTHPKTPSVTSTKRVIIPRSAHTYTARAIDPTERGYRAQYKKQVAGHQTDLFNLQALNGADVAVVVEGELDAISIEQASGVPCVGIGSISNVGRFADSAARISRETALVVALDADQTKPDGRNPGRDAQERLCALLRARGVSCVGADVSELYGGSKDANEALQKDPQALAAAVEEWTARAIDARDGEREEEELERAKATGAGMVLDFMRRAQTRAYEPVPTGIGCLDAAIGGGFVRGTLVFLGAAPGSGKTVLAQQVAESMARQGHSVHYASLEMSRDQMLARTISRICAHDGLRVTPSEVMRGYQWDDQLRQAIEDAGVRYVLDLGGERITYGEGDSASLDALLETLERQALRAEAEGRPAPISVVDYLQLLQGGEHEDEVQVIKRAVKGLKDHAIRHNTTVLAIHATNRASNKSGEVQQWSGRDTSAIEYSGDLMLGLTYTAVEKGWKIDGETATPALIMDRRRRAYEAGERVPDECRRMTLKVLKNRHGELGRSADLIFDGEAARFLPAK